MKHFFQGVLFLITLLLIACNPNDISINQKKVNIDSLAINVSVEDSMILSVNGSVDTIENKNYSWKSLATNIASVSKGGVVKGINSGTTQIIVTSNVDQTKKDTCYVVVLAVGTATNPYKIRSIKDLKVMRDRVNNQPANYATKYYQLMNDLDFSNEPGWYPIGSGNTSFSGQFDGNNKVIRGLKLSDSTNVIRSGLFGNVYNGKIFNLGVVSNTISESRQYVGGIVGWLQGGSMVNCYHEGNLGGVSYVGGLIGYAYQTTITDSHSTGEIRCNSTDFISAGGLVGALYQTDVNNCYTKGKVISNYEAGGIVGYGNKASMSNCYSETEVVTNMKNSSNFCKAGGIAGSTDNFTFNQCYHIGNVTAYTGIAGGITGSGGNFYNCFSAGNISSIANLSDSYYMTYATAGGITGSGGSVYNCYTSGRIYAYGHANCYSGGIAGYASLISNSYSNSTVYTQVTGGSAYGESAYAGGIAGECPKVNSSIALNDSIVAVSEQQYSYSGNIVGKYIDDSYNNNTTYQFSSNFAKTTNKLYTGNSINDKTAVSNYSDYNKFGNPLVGDILTLLNNYVTQNIAVNTITLKSWVVNSGYNNGLPIFK